MATVDLPMSLYRWNPTAPPTKARKLGTAEATDADAIKKAAKEFKVPDQRKLIAVARRA